MFIPILILVFKFFLTFVLCEAGDGINCEDSPPRDFEQLQKYAHIASVAYCLEKGLGLGQVGTQGIRCPSRACSHKETENLVVVETFEFNGVFEVGSGIIAIDDPGKTIYLAFMGTSSIQDWLNNLSIIPVSYQPLVVTSDEFNAVDTRDCVKCRVHKGINSFLKLNGAVVLNAVLKAKKELPDYRLVVTGHSLGAAIATFAAIELKLLGLDVLVVTLAGPKIGEKNFAKFVDELFDTVNVIDIISKEKSFDHINTALIRMVHIHDIVPYLPPTKTKGHKLC
ncbi:hypothetical protein JCM33374_g2832 [Metschnikowia sp. JCM 33374]|nr:hypothetical protein JCM33374_g2832 [Metschnikowia sp. JCM 33374]